MSTGWNVFVIALIVLNIAACAWLLFANRSIKVDPASKGKTLGHDFDGIQELNNPLPAWWSWLFVVTIVFGVIYFVLYPGLGNVPGVLGWSQKGQYEAQVAAAEAKYGPIFDSYLETPLPELLDDERALRMGSRIFAVNCSTCHGSDARGNTGYPNLTDGAWLWGGSPEQVVATITHGRQGVMPALGAAIGGQEAIEEVTEYVLSLSGRPHDAKLAAIGEEHFQAICAACHGPEGKGMAMMGAPDLTDDVWLHGGRRDDILYQVREGRVNKMPAWGPILGEEKVHLVAAYVLSLSRGSP